jgi:hypothetical protein
VSQSRYYTIDGQQFPRVSTVLGIINKPFLATWRGKVGNQEADRVARVATDWGTRVHAACAQLCGGPAVDEDPELWPTVNAFGDWLTANVRDVVACERLVVSRQRHYAGTCDLLATLTDGSLAVVDLKTSKQLSPEYALQLAAYRLALREEGRDVTRRLVVWLPKAEPGVVRTQDYPDHARDEHTFLAALVLWRRLQGEETA